MAVLLLAWPEKTKLAHGRVKSQPANRIGTRGFSDDRRHQQRRQRHGRGDAIHGSDAERDSHAVCRYFSILGVVVHAVSIGDGQQAQVPSGMGVILVRQHPAAGLLEADGVVRPAAEGFCAVIRPDATTLTLEPVQEPLVPVKLWGTFQRLSLASEDYAHCIAVYEPADEIRPASMITAPS